MGIELKYIGWSSFIFTDNKGFKMMTDPFLCGNKDFKILPSPIAPQAVKTDLIICSHCSSDHFAQAFEIMDANPNSKLLGDLATLAIAERAGYGNYLDGRTELITAGAAYAKSDFIVHATSARHIAFQTLENGTFITGEPLCYIIEIKGGPTCFFGGDTSLTYDMKLWGDLYKPEIAILGIGGADLNGRSLRELSPKDAAICAKMLGVKKAIPMHYRLKSDVEEFRRSMVEIYPDCQIIEMREKDIIELS